MEALVQYDLGLSKAVEKGFKEREWAYSVPNREWHNGRIPYSVKSLQDQKI